MLDISSGIDTVTQALLAQVSSASALEGLDFFVVGATARDIILYHGFGISPGTATVDVDIAVLVSEWRQFSKLKEALLATGSFSATGATQRLLYQRRLPLDIVPFGALAVDGQIRWPPDEATVMSVLGFAEAHEQAISVLVRQTPKLVVKFASPAGWALLKFISWNDRGQFSGKDAQDLLTILSHYADAGHEERLYEEESELLAGEDFDIVLAGARLLGRDIARLSRPETRALVGDILARETDAAGSYGLITAMLRGRRIEPERAFDATLLLVAKLKEGFEEGEGSNEQ